jgi:AraC-like DNA-binding protein
MKRRSCIRIADATSPDPVPGLEPGNDLLANLRPYVRHCGDSRRPAWHVEPRKLLDYLLVHIAEGRGRFIVAGRSYEAMPGDLFWVPPDTVHDMEGFAPGMHCSYVHFDLLYRPAHSHWDFSIPGGMTDLAELRPLMHPPVPDPRLAALTGCIRGPTNLRVGQLILDICAEATRAQSFAGLRMSGLMVEIVAELLRGREGLPVEYMAHIPLIETTAELMVRQCMTPLTLPDLARRCRLSVSHFRYLFHRHYGCSPRTYVRRARLNKARELMVGTALTLSEIAAQVGFETVHSLSRAFRAEEGLSPTQYRHCAAVRTRVEGRNAPYAR